MAIAAACVRLTTQITSQTPCCSCESNYEYTIRADRLLYLFYEDPAIKLNLPLFA